MKEKKSILQEITATVMPQTEAGLHALMAQARLTIGEVIDRLSCLKLRQVSTGLAFLFAVWDRSQMRIGGEL